jgi:hypothetical protein
MTSTAVVKGLCRGKSSPTNAVRDATELEQYVLSATTAERQIRSSSILVGVKIDTFFAAAQLNKAAGSKLQIYA